MKMSIDLEKNRTHILQVHNYVLDDKSPTNWALFGYEGQTNVLKVVGWGDDGLEELSEELNASKIMYGVLRIEDPKTSRTKIILLNWQGEGAPNLRKGVCARHLPEVKRMLKGIHITVSARTEDDVDPDVILNSVAKATSTEYNFKERSELPDKNVPVGTNYKRTLPQVEIDSNSRNKFWEEQEAEEKVRKEEEIKKREQEQKKLEKERVERELRDSKHREEINRERSARILAGKKAEMTATENTKRLTAGFGGGGGGTRVGGRRIEGGGVSGGSSGSSSSQAWNKEEENQLREDEEVERARRADHMRMQRKKEAESLIGHKTHEARSIFESQSHINNSRTSLSKPPPRKLKEFNLATAEESNSIQRDTVPPKKAVGSRWPPPSQDHVEENRKTVPGKITDWKPIEIEASVQNDQKVFNSFQHEASSNTLPNDKYDTSTSESRHTDSVQPNAISTSHHYTPTSSITTPAASSLVTVVSSSPSFTPLLSTTASPPKTPPSFNDEVDTDSGLRNGTSEREFVHNGVEREEEDLPVSQRTNEPVTQYDDHETGADYAGEAEDFASVCMTYEVDGVEYQILPEHGLCARALYDYQAADDTEITFDPGDIITNIDQIDVGWWQGVSPVGVFGLFPANYVELINGTKIH
ncbi:Drebrin-like protein [Armadillidium nasatum]|uniref:Drebrin-like protein n=1 Tax=Armadillidium nasatum TaxID=96803 RepID=A0A5N5SWY2_9CRUS|nr:Drebrin-like protein [Armadillidium nasatum]